MSTKDRGICCHRVSSGFVGYSSFRAFEICNSPQSEEMMTRAMIKAKVAQLKTEHPAFAAILDQVQSMNEVDTLKAILAVHKLERILDAHALNLFAAAMHNVTS